MPNKLTDTEIKKALEICASEHLGCEDGCPYVTNSDSCSLKENALDLINRQEEEIEQLRETIFYGDFSSITALRAKESWSRKNAEYIDRLNEENESLKAEVERLQETTKIMSAYIKGNNWGLISFVEFCKNLKAEAYKEFAEEIENINLSNSDDYFEFKRSRFDNLLNELVGDADAKDG